MNNRPLLKLLVVAALVTVSTVAAAAKPGDPTVVSTAVPAGPSVDKTYTLFMGADVSIERNKELHRVRDVSGGSLVINVKGEPIFVPIGGAPVSFKVDPQLKLTTVSAVLDQFRYERAYTAMNDPIRQFTREQAAAGANAQSEAAVRNMIDAQAGLNGARQFAAGIPKDTPERIQMAAQIVVGAERAAIQVDARASAAFASEAGSFNQTGTHAARLQRALDAEAFDAIEIKFAVTAAEPLNRPYLIVLAKFRAPEDKPNAIRQWIYAKELAPITESSREIRFLQGGFPPGFELKELQLRLYNAGREVATNLSPSRVPLTLGEAFQYVMIDYLASHKGATVPAAVALGKLPPDLLAHVSPTQLQTAYYVRVSKDGMPVRVGLDSEGAESLSDPYLTGILQGLRFKPALEKGKPTEGVVRVKLGELLTSL